MRAELIELLRCPQSHEPTPLVTVSYARDGDQLLEGMLGCPVCGAEFALHDGVADLRSSHLARLAGVVAAVHPEPEHGVPEHTAHRPDASRTAAFLALTDPSMRVALCGAYASVAAEISTFTGVQCIAMNPREDIPVDVTDRLRLDAAERIPLANASLAGMAIDLTHRLYLQDATRVVRTGGRIVAPAYMPTPPGCNELARDADEWVAVVTATPTTPVAILRGKTV